MKTYDIYDLYGNAWVEAIDEVIEKINSEMGTKFFAERDAHGIEGLAHKLRIRFNENGEIA